MFDILQIPTNELDFFIRKMEISSYIPGRVRLYNKDLIGNDKLAKEVKQYLSAFGEITEISINIVSGSVLLTYDVENLRKNKELKKVEEYIALHARRK